MTVEVFQDTNFEEGWKDSAVPNMSFNYDPGRETITVPPGTYGVKPEE
jgi:hypothetical protein